MLETLFERFDGLIVLDTETTGFTPRRDEVIELAMLRLTPDGAEEEYDEFIRLSPGKELPRRITELTGITEDMLRLGVSKASAARALADMLGKGSVRSSAPTTRSSTWCSSIICSTPTGSPGRCAR